LVCPELEADERAVLNGTMSKDEFIERAGYPPESEKISLGLFHCLWGRGKQEEALEEMRRFLTSADSEEYRLILENLPKADSE
jgi:hypothetical protein